MKDEETWSPEIVERHLITGRGTVFHVISDRLIEKDKPEDKLIGRKVLAAGEVWIITGVESWGRPIIKRGEHIGLLVRPMRLETGE